MIATVSSASAIPLATLLEKYPNLDKLLGVRCPVIAVLADKVMHLNSVLKLDIGSVIVFPKHNTDSIHLLVNNVVVGAGKTIKVGDHFGLHLRSISQEAVIESVL